MNVERCIRAIAGSFVVLSLGLGYLVSPYWHLFTAFVGLNLFQSAFTVVPDGIAPHTSGRCQHDRTSRPTEDLT